MDIQEPLTPKDCDLRGFEWMPFFGSILYDSDFDARATDEEFRIALRLWWKSWQQVPAASLPDDDIVLRKFAGLERDPKTWSRIKEMVLWGFVKCSDGRLYHRFLAPEAVNAYGQKLRKAKDREADRERLKKWRELKATKRQRKASETGGNGADETPMEKPGNGHDTHPETPHETHRETPSETRFKTPDETGSETAWKPPRNALLQDRTVQNRDTPPIAPPRGGDTDPDPPSSGILAEFEVWYRRYPVKKAKDRALSAYKRARKRASAEQLLDAVSHYQWHPDPQYIKHPATWLNGGCWMDEPDPQPRPELEKSPTLESINMLMNWGKNPCPDPFQGPVWEHESEEEMRH